MQKLNIRTLDKKQQFDVMLNPAGIRHEHGINYTNRAAAGNRALGSLAPRLAFASYQSESLSFEMMIDGTGVVEQPQKPDVAGQIAQLKNVVYRYVGDKHEPCVVVLTWGTLSFKGRLTRLAIRYSLFDAAARRCAPPSSCVSTTIWTTASRRCAPTAPRLTSPTAWW
nr:hypothetical protein [Dickeya dadantii]